MENVIVIVVIAVIIGLAGGYIRKEKKRGAKCIGCPSGGSCNGKCGGNCSGDLERKSRR